MNPKQLYYYLIWFYHDNYCFILIIPRSKKHMVIEDGMG